MSNLSFTTFEIRLATVTLAALSVMAPAIYYLERKTRQECTPHVQTFRKYLAAYSTLRPQALTANASRDFTHVVFPSALQIPTRTLSQFEIHSAMIFSLFSDFKMVPQALGSASAVHFCKETNTVIAHCKMGGKVNGGSEKGRVLVESGVTEWWTECVLFVRLDEAGQRVVEVREFVNSERAAELKRRLEGILEG
ncbi:hypothetical protein K505DRAFT_329586 [Melanomma pulvis-pyrius CBS 109.77]|uniref:SnoaL-like domain-containing protein n=1 Tax=Melanomma pulvis-pyrius CBS 109.77 TaxID=1314802 RepID=A0A6A6WUN9_9PLEO|nr:hypothetical protein K505DRAFT_329586 [Melanomma pulvis-pyrius CBS 109.77]